MNLKKNLVKCTVALSLATMLSIPTNGLAYKEVRIGGHDRFDVAINISKKYENSDTCYLINYLAYPDAIASSNYIKDRNGKHIPIYYTKSDKVDTKTLNHLKTKRYKEIVIFGGEKSVSNKVIQQLQNNGFKVSRSSAGKNRYDTVNQLLIGSTNYEDENIILVSGENFADSLIATSLAKKLNCKIIITQNNEIDKTIKNEFFNTNKKQRAKVNNVYIVGGEKSISKNIEQQFSTVAKVHRISGRDRYNTSLQLAKEIGNEKYTIVSGENFADNLVAIPYSYTNNSTIVLTSSKSISNNLKSLIKNKDFTIVGGEKSVPNEILELENKDSVKPDDKKEQEEPEDINNREDQEKPEDKEKQENQFITITTFPFAEINLKAKSFEEALKLSENIKQYPYEISIPYDMLEKLYNDDHEILRHSIIIRNKSDLNGLKIMYYDEIKMKKELKTVAKSALNYGKGNDKKTVEYIIKWICNNTTYDQRHYSKNIQDQIDAIGHPVLWYQDRIKSNKKVGRGVCDLYAALFNQLCKYANIQSESVSVGIKTEQYDHTINVAKINNQWLYFDVTFYDYGDKNKTFNNLGNYPRFFATRTNMQKLYKRMEKINLN